MHDHGQWGVCVYAYHGLRRLVYTKHVTYAITQPEEVTAFP